MSVSAGNHLITLEPSTFLINVSYTEVIIKISALNRFLLARSAWRFHRCGFRESSLGLLEGSERSEKRCPGLVFCTRAVLYIILYVIIVSRIVHLLLERGRQASC